MYKRCVTHSNRFQNNSVSFSENIWLKNCHTLSLPSFNKRCRVGQGVKTPPFHGGITGSNPVLGTKKLRAARGIASRESLSEMRGFFVFGVISGGDEDEGGNKNPCNCRVKGCALLKYFTKNLF